MRREPRPAASTTPTATTTTTHTGGVGDQRDRPRDPGRENQQRVPGRQRLTAPSSPRPSPPATEHREQTVQASRLYRPRPPHCRPQPPCRAVIIYGFSPPSSRPDPDEQPPRPNPEPTTIVDLLSRSHCPDIEPHIKPPPQTTRH